MLNNEHEFTESTRIKKDKKDLKDLDRFEWFTFPRFANSDRWFSPQATKEQWPLVLAAGDWKKGVRFAQKSYKSFQIKQISSAQRAEAIITVHQVTYQIEKTEVSRLLMLNNEH